MGIVATTQEVMPDLERHHDSTPQTRVWCIKRTCWPEVWGLGFGARGFKRYWVIVYGPFPSIGSGNKGFDHSVINRLRLKFPTGLQSQIRFSWLRTAFLLEHVVRCINTCIEVCGCSANSVEWREHTRSPSPGAPHAGASRLIPLRGGGQECVTWIDRGSRGYRRSLITRSGNRRSGWYHHRTSGSNT